jgi:hypothetical protein
MRMRELVFDVGDETEGVGELVETVKWRQPAYLPSRPRIGSTVRLGALRNTEYHYAVFVHCQTTLIEEFQTYYSDQFDFDGERAIRFSRGTPVNVDALKHCVALALTYHLRSRPGTKAHGF